MGRPVNLNTLRIPKHLLNDLITRRTPPETTPTDHLADTPGLTPNIIREITRTPRAGREYVSFTTADRITTALNANEVWNTEPWRKLIDEAVDSYLQHMDGTVELACRCGGVRIVSARTVRAAGGVDGYLRRHASCPECGKRTR